MPTVQGYEDLLPYLFFSDSSSEDEDFTANLHSVTGPLEAAVRLGHCLLSIFTGWSG